MMLGNSVKVKGLVECSREKKDYELVELDTVYVLFFDGSKFREFYVLLAKFWSMNFHVAQPHSRVEEDQFAKYKPLEKNHVYSNEPSYAQSGQSSTQRSKYDLLVALGGNDISHL